MNWWFAWMDWNYQVAYWEAVELQERWYRLLERLSATNNDQDQSKDR